MNIIKNLKGGLIVSCQPVVDGPMDSPDIIAAMAHAAISGGADGVRIEGAENVRVTRARISKPIVGIMKRDLDDSLVRITPFLEDVVALKEAGADIIAFDSTDRPRPVPRANIIKEIHKQQCLAMADCSSLEDAKYAVDLGVEIIGTTLSGYTRETEGMGKEPDLALLKEFRHLNSFVMAEGRYSTPALARSALEAGADCVTVGTPLTRLEVNTAEFRQALTDWEMKHG